MPTLSYFLKAILAGLLLAAALLFLFPSLRGDSQLLEKWFQTSPPQKQPFSLSQAVRKASPAVVNVYSRSLVRSSIWGQAELQTRGLGSGVIMTEQGHILTNSHVIRGADQILVGLQDGRIYSAKLIGTDVFTDLAVLFIEDDNLPVIPQQQGYSPEVGDLVLAIGNPYNLGQTITQGVISAAGRSGMASTSYQALIQTDAAINRGNSGGALVNSEGVLVGINTAAFQDNNEQEIYGISFAVPYALAHKVMLGIIKYGRVIRGYLGITGGQLSSTQAQQLRLGERTGILIKGVARGGPADQAGLQVDDVILQLNEQNIHEVNLAMDAIAETAPGTQIMVTVLRGGRIIQLPVILSEPPLPNQITR